MSDFGKQEVLLVMSYDFTPEEEIQYLRRRAAFLENKLKSVYNRCSKLVKMCDELRENREKHRCNSAEIGIGNVPI